MKKPYNKTLFILFPAVAMLLGWGLRGYIGGGPFGAMIPGALVMLTICMLLEIPAPFAAAYVLFGTVGIGFGGEMTYGQTLGFLRSPDTVWWGTLGTTLKGGVWGFLGGAFISMGFLFRKLGTRNLVLAFALMIVFLLLGFLLINDPKVLYFSDPVNKPRSESWAGLLLAAVALVTFLKFTVKKPDFILVKRFSAMGALGGALGFGIGGMWMVLGSTMPPDMYFRSWWKMMEFTFGCILGGAFGYAAWQSRQQIRALANDAEWTVPLADKRVELTAVLLIALVIYVAIPYPIGNLLDTTPSISNVGSAILYQAGRILVNFMFIGCALVFLNIRQPWLLWQSAITVTFCHAVIDYVEDLGPENGVQAPVLFMVVFVTSAVLIAAYLVSVFQRGKNVVRNMLFLMTWSCMLVAYLKLLSNTTVLYPQPGDPGVWSRIGDVVLAHLPVHAIFTVAAVYVTYVALKMSHVQIKMNRIPH
jgi:hypothetical protein